MAQITLSQKDIEEVLEYKAHVAATYAAEERAKDTAFKLSRNYTKQSRIYDYIRGITNGLPKMSPAKINQVEIARNQYRLAMAIA